LFAVQNYIQAEEARIKVLQGNLSSRLVPRQQQPNPAA
jgi:hypothetical protein